MDHLVIHVLRHVDVIRTLGNKYIKGNMNLLNNRGYVLEATLQRHKVSDFKTYPFSLPVIRNLETLVFHPKVTFLVGENGSGKSTLLEAIALSLGFNPEGGTKYTQFSTNATHSFLHQYLNTVKSHKTAKDGYFLRAESFYNTVSYLEEIQKDVPWENVFASYGGESLHTKSHGEAFISLLNHKFKGKGLYILDEPEAALSPARQLSALAIIHELVRNDSQFIIATHSPILMAYPDATIYLLSENGIEEVEYKDTDHYIITKDFLNKPEKIIRDLLD